MSASQRQEFCVRWNSHLGSIGAAFPQLLAGQRFVDVTLACEGHQVHCHRLVLAACSSYFESILAENPCKHPVIILPSEIKLWEIQALVDFMYKGEVNVTQAGLPQLLRCAEQLRIRGLYGSDAALNLNQLKALTSKAAAAAAAAAAANAMNAGGGGGSGGGGSVINDNSMETDDTNSTTTTTATAASALQQLQAGSMAAAMAAQQHQQLHHLKKELPALQQQQQQQHHHHHHQQQSNGTIAQNVLQQNHNLQQQQLHLPQIKQEVTGLTHVVNAAAAIAAAAANSNAATEEDDESADDSTSNAYDRYEQYAATQQSAAASNNVAAATASAAANAAAIAAAHAHLDSTVEDDHNYVAHDEDSSYGPNADTEHETSANSSSATLLQGAVDAAGSYKRVRRSEASLAQAAKCVSKGQTFQTVSNMFNIPVSTIRFYMARKGILPRRKRGRGASSANSGGAAGAMNAVSAAAMSQALAQMKRSGSPPLAEALYHHQLMSGGGAAGGGAAGASYKLNEQGAAHLI